MKALPVLFGLSAWGLTAPGEAVAMADAEPFLQAGRLATGLSGNVEIPSLGTRADGRIYCVFSQNMERIWVMWTDDAGKSWSKPVRVMECPGPGYITDANILVGKERLTLFATFVPSNAERKFRESRFLASGSADGGLTWSTPEPLPIPHRYVVGKIHTPVWLDDESVVMGYSWDVPAEEGKPAASEGGMFLKSGALISHDAGHTWTPGADVAIDIHPIGADEPAIVRLGDGSLFMVLRTATQRPYETRSRDRGQTWETPNPAACFGYNSPSALLRLRDGSILRAWNNSPTNRFPLVVAASTDEAKTWSPPRTITEPALLDDGKLSFNRACYPSLAEAADGTLLIVWWERTDAGVNSLGWARLNRAWVDEARSLPRPRTIVAFGDSITKGVRPGVNEYQTFRFLLERRLRAAGIDAQVLNAGVGSNTTRDARARFDIDVLASRPDVVTIFFGANDAAMVDAGPKARTEPRVPLDEYRENLAYLARRCKAAGARVILCVPTPMTPAYAYSSFGPYAGKEMNFMLARYAEAARDVARENEVACVDLYRLFIDDPKRLSFLSDGCHPYAEGHRVIADALLEPVRAALQDR